jgi:hypothetical protein
MAVEEINNAGGFQARRSAIAAGPTQPSTQDALAVATQLVRDDKVKIIWGPASVGDPESTTITQQEHVLHICPCPQRELTALSSQDKVDNQNSWAFQTLSAPSKFLASGARNAAVENPDFHTFATICADSETGKPSATSSAGLTGPPLPSAKCSSPARRLPSLLTGSRR